MLIIGESHLVPCLFSGLPWIPASFRLLSLLLKMGVGGDIQRPSCSVVPLVLRMQHKVMTRDSPCSKYIKWGLCERKWKCREGMLIVPLYATFLG